MLHLVLVSYKLLSNDYARNYNRQALAIAQIFLNPLLFQYVLPHVTKVEQNFLLKYVYFNTFVLFILLRVVAISMC